MGDDVDDPNTYLVTFDDKAARYLVMTLSLSHLLLFLLESSKSMILRGPVFPLESSNAE